MEVMAIIGFILVHGLGLWFLCVGGASMVGLAMFTGELLTPLLCFPIIGAALIWAAWHWAPFSIVVSVQ